MLAKYPDPVSMCTCSRGQNKRACKPGLVTLRSAPTNSLSFHEGKSVQPRAHARSTHARANAQTHTHTRTHT